MQQLNSLDDNQTINSGSIVRLFDVGRFDIMKTAFDRENSDKKHLDFYDYLVVNMNLIKDKTYCLVNITRDNGNRGSLLCQFEVPYELKASQLKKYFGVKAIVFVELNN